MNIRVCGLRLDFRFWLCVLIAAEFALFYNYVQREIAWAYPVGSDQSEYLYETYAIFHQAQEVGLFESLGSYLHKESANGIMLPLQGAFFQLFFGVGRLSALLLNFLYLCLFEVVLFKTARWLGGRDCHGWLAIGLLLLVRSPFIITGGMFDFRLDHIAWCLYGIFTCFILRSENLQNRRWLAWAAGSAVLLVSFRTITFVYLSGFFMMLGTGILVLYWLRKKREEERRLLAASLKNTVITGVIWLVFSVPMIIVNWKTIYEYYVVGHLTGGEKHIRAAEFGVHTMGDHLTYYIKSVALDHLGRQYLAVSAILLLASLVLWLRGERKKNSGGGTTGSLHWVSAWAMASIIFPPWLVLTAMESKSPVVGSIFVAPVILFVIYCVSRRKPLDEAGFSSKLLGNTAASLVLLFGIGNWLELTARPSTLNTDEYRASSQEINNLYDYVADYCKKYDVPSPVLSSDLINAWLGASTVTVHLYEREGYWLDASGSLGYTLFAMKREDVFHDLAISDFVFLTSHPKKGLLYPFYQTMQELEPDMKAWCESNLMRGRQFSIENGTVTAYIKPKPLIEGYSGEWITPAGIRLRVPGGILSWLASHRKKSLVLEGGDYPELLTKPPQARAELQENSNSTGTTLPVTFTRLPGNRYRIVISLDSILATAGNADEKTIELTLENSYFVPKEVGIGKDTRQLVVKRPAEVHFE